MERYQREFIRDVTAHLRDSPSDDQETWRLMEIYGGYVGDTFELNLPRSPQEVDPTVLTHNPVVLRALLQAKLRKLKK